MAYQVFEGSPRVKSMLELLLHEQGGKETGLEDFLRDLEETEALSGSWWAVVDSNKEPRGALTVRYLNDLSYLGSIWTRVSKLEDAKIASEALLHKWVINARSGTKIFQADIPINSLLANSIVDAGFKKEKILIISYDLETKWIAEELPDGYIMRSVNRDEMDYIYEKLIGPELDPSSPIYVSPENFRDFGTRLPDFAKRSWVVVEDDEYKIVGFGASILNIEKKGAKAILYGPHSREPRVIRSIIAEMSSFWRSLDIDYLRILRTSEFHPNIVNSFSMKLKHSTIRYIKQ